MGNYEEYAWIVVLGAFMAFFMAYGIGANDVANAFATSVGSKTLTLVQACILAGIFEFLGALLLGRGVTDTIRKGIVDREVFEDSPEILMYGMFCALCAAGIWLIMATALEMPVSTTHSIIGGIVGMALVAYGREAVVWYDYDADEVFPIKGITAVVISWVFSPVASGIVAAIFFWVARTFILRAKDSYKKAFFFLPLLVGIAAFINAFYVLDKAITKQWGWLKETGGTGASAWIAAIIATVSMLAGVAFSFWLKKKVDKQIEEGKLQADVEANGTKEAKESGGFFGKMADAINSNDPHATLEDDADVAAMHARAEVFPSETEEVFRYLQVLTSCCDAFAHGANDVANSIGPFSAIWHVYRKQALTKKSDVPIWILFIGGIGIVVGLATYGYSIIRAIGIKLTKITPSRGFSIEMGSALIVVTGSYLGLPLSTTHCQVGATAFVGLLEGTGGVSWSVIGKTVFGWVFTLIIVGLMSALMMVLGIRTPNVRNSNSINAVERSVVAGGAVAGASLDELNCSSPALQDTGRFFRYFENNFRFQDAVGDAVAYMSGIQELSSGATNCPAPFNGNAKTFQNAYRSIIGADDKQLALAEKAIGAQASLEEAAAKDVVSDGAKALEAYGEECPGTPAATVEKWAAVFAAFEGGTVVSKRGASTNFIADAEKLIAELEDVVDKDDVACADVSDITAQPVYLQVAGPTRRL